MQGINWGYFSDPNDLNNSIIKQDENWEGLFDASQIISIYFDTHQGCYVVFWRIEI